MKKLKIILQSNTFYLFLFLFLSGYIVFFTCIKRYKTQLPDTTSEIVGILTSYTIDGDKLSMILEAEEKISATYYIQSEDEKNTLENELKLGLKLKLVGNQKEVIGMTIPNTFDYQKYLYNQHIYFCFNVTKLEIQNQNLSFFYMIKNKIEKRIQKLGNDSYLRAFVLGDKTLIDQEQYENIMKNGISHLFALSGMHLSFIYMFLNKFLGKVKLKKVFIYSLLFLYLFITGFSVSFFRAILFLLLLDINKKYDLRLSRVKVLFLTAFIILSLDPFYIYQVGFWYTFVVTFSLLFCSENINNHGKLVQIILVSVITFFFSLPISIYVNYEINFAAIFNNIVLVPFISTIIFPLALLSFLCSFFLPVFQFFILVLEKMNLFFADFAMPIVFGKISIIEILIYYTFLMLGLKLRAKKFFAFLFLLLVFFYHKNLFVMDYHVYFLDVGQGDAALFVSPQNKEVIMIDTGGNVTYPKKDFQKRNKEFNLADNIVLFLKSIRVRKIDLLLITHGDKDHLGYASTIGESIPFKNIMINEGEINNEEEKLLKCFKRADNYQAREFDFETYFLGHFDNENDNSIITKVKIHSHTFLLMGDASSKVETELMKQKDVSSYFLKLGHHGSNTSSSFAFLKAVTPKYAIVSAGRNNRYHHPSKETIDNLRKLNIPILNTQEMGTIQIKIGKRNFHIKKTLA